MASILFDVYHSFYDKFMKTFHLDDHQAIISSLEALSRNGPLAIADIGGGTGLLADRLIRLGHAVTLIDPAKKMTEIAKQRNPEMKIINELFENYPASDLSYDVIILRDCFHHLQDQALTLAKIFQVLKDDGLLVIQEFSPTSISAKLLFTFERCCLEKVSPVDAGTLSKMMNQANFLSTHTRLNNRDYLVTGVKKKP